MSKEKRGTVSLKRYLLDLREGDVKFNANEHMHQRDAVAIALKTTQEALRNASDANQQSIDRKIEVRFMELGGRLDAIDKRLALKDNVNSGTRIGRSDVVALVAFIGMLVAIYFAVRP